MTYIKARKSNFRPSEANHRKEEVYISSIFNKFLILISLLIVSSATQANNMTEQALQQVIENHLDKELALLAKQREWQNFQPQWQVWIPGSVKHLKVCETPLVISGQDNQLLPVGNLKRSVDCYDDNSSWSINVTIKASLSLPVVVVSTPLSRDQKIDASMLKMEMRTLTHQDDFFTKLSDAIGKQATRRMRVGQILEPTLVTAPPIVTKGNEVIIIASKNGVNASTQGVALEDGGLGEQIEVQNSSSHTVIHAVVTGLNQVQTQF
ncbi:flagella basal body P-ring formation protein FlgA [Vibrio diazotrophicus]|nr:flagella basal body P-ring formation protein FlgA [Vibrio diazotrophicus]